MMTSNWTEPLTREVCNACGGTLHLVGGARMVVVLDMPVSVSSMAQCTGCNRVVCVKLTGDVVKPALTVLEISPFDYFSDFGRVELVSRADMEKAPSL